VTTALTPALTPALPNAFLRLPLAHRGLHDAVRGRIENSRDAVAAACAAGYGIEIDVQLTADGAALVFHDTELDRLTTKSGPVRARSLAELQALPLRGGQDGPPELSEVAAFVAGRVPLLVELKDQSGTFGPESEALAAAVAGALEGRTDNVAVMSFNPHTVQHLARLLPHVPRGLTTMDFSHKKGLDAAQRAALNEIATFEAVGAAFVSHDHCSLHMSALDRLRARAVPILTWTIRSPAEAAEALKHADNITFEGFEPPRPVPDP